MLVIALLPLLMLGRQMTLEFWKTAWPIWAVLAVLLVGLNIFFAANYRLITLLEKEDWPALAYYLEQQLYLKKRYSFRKVKLLANSYMVMCDFAAIFRLEAKVSAIKPALVQKNALVFGTARLLNNEYRDAAVFFRNCLEKGKVKSIEMVRWFYGFSQILAGNFDFAEEELKKLALSSGDALITGLSAFFLDTVLLRRSFKPDECRLAAKTGRERVCRVLKAIQAWNKEGEKAGNEVYTVIIKKYIEETGLWLYGPGEKPENPAKITEKSG
jgi:hypothetical protein